MHTILFDSRTARLQGFRPDGRGNTLSRRTIARQNHWAFVVVVIVVSFPDRQAKAHVRGLHNRRNEARGCHTHCNLENLPHDCVTMLQDALGRKRRTRNGKKTWRASSVCQYPCQRWPESCGLDTDSEVMPFHSEAGVGLNGIFAPGAAP